MLISYLYESHDFTFFKKKKPLNTSYLHQVYSWSSSTAPSIRSITIHCFINIWSQELQHFLSILLYSPYFVSNLFPSLLFTGAPIQMHQILMDSVSRFLVVWMHLSWHSIPNFVIYTFSAQFKNFSMSNISQRQPHIQFPCPIYSTFQTSLHFSTLFLFHHYSSCSMDRKLIWTTLEGGWSVNKKLLLSLKKMGMAWCGIDYHDISSYVLQGSCLHSLLECHVFVQKRSWGSEKRMSKSFGTGWKRTIY